MAAMASMVYEGQRALRQAQNYAKAAKRALQKMNNLEQDCYVVLFFNGCFLLEIGFGSGGFDL